MIYSIVAKKFPEIRCRLYILRAITIFSMVSGLHLRCPLAPHPNPPPRRGEAVKKLCKKVLT